MQMQLVHENMRAMRMRTGYNGDAMRASGAQPASAAVLDCVGVGQLREWQAAEPRHPRCGRTRAIAAAADAATAAAASCIWSRGVLDSHPRRADRTLAVAALCNDIERGVGRNIPPAAGLRGRAVGRDRPVIHRVDVEVRPRDRRHAHAPRVRKAAVGDERGDEPNRRAHGHLVGHHAAVAAAGEVHAPRVQTEGRGRRQRLDECGEETDIVGA